MSKLKLAVISLLLSIFLIACNSNEENGTEPEENGTPVEEDNSESTESNGEDDNTDGEVADNDSSESDDVEESSNNSEGSLSLGETGTIESTLGDYEITFESFQLLDELEDENNEDEIFIILDVTVNNIGDEALNGEDLYTSRLYDDTGSSQEDTFYFETVDIMEGTIEPGETMEGQFVFGAKKEAESFELVYNHGFDAVATELTWEFTVDEASN